MLDRRLRKGVERGLGPAGARLRRLGVSADALTVVGLLCSVGTALLIASGHLLWAVVGIIVTGVSDLLDGAIARGSGQASPRGAFFDSVADRASDGLLFGGVAWYLVSSSGSPYYAILAFAVATCSMLISYERAKADALGIDARGGIMERAERFVFLGVACAFDIFVPVLWVMLALTAFTAVQRFVRVYRLADRPPQPTHTHRRRFTRAGADDAASDDDPTSRVALRTWFAARRVESQRSRRAHRTPRRSSRP